MTGDNRERTGFLNFYAKNWRTRIIHVHLDKEILHIKSSLILLGEKYIRKGSYGYNDELHSQEVSKRRKVLADIKCLPREIKDALSLSLPLFIFIFKAYEELFFHGLRSCQRYLVEIISSEKLLNTIDNEIVNDGDLKCILSKIDFLIGQYSEDYESVFHFFKKLDANLYGKDEAFEVRNYSHPKFKYLENVVTTYFQAFPSAKAIIFCQSSFHMLEICNFLLNLQPLVKPMIYIDKCRKNGTPKESFSQEAKNIVKKMFDCGQFNTLVRSCTDIQCMNLEEAQLLIHFDVDQHHLKETLWTTNYNDSVPSQVELFFCRPEIGKVLLSDINPDSLNFTVKRKRKISELNGSNSNKSIVGKKVKQITMGEPDIAFDCAFDSLELDDRFLSKLDAEAGKEKNTREEHSIVSLPRKVSKFEGKGEALNDTEVKMKYYDLPLSVNDLSELNCNFKVQLAGNDSPYNEVAHSTDKKLHMSYDLNMLATCVSPILGKLSSTSGIVSSSTPLRKLKDESFNKKEKKESDTPIKSITENAQNTEYEYLDFDLFEDWDNAPEQKSQESKSLITISQAVELVEETKKSSESNPKMKLELPHNTSMDGCAKLQTEDIIRHKEDTLDNLFAESFNLSQLESLEKKTKQPHLSVESSSKAFSSNINKSIILDFGDTFEKKINNASCAKPLAVQKLNFENMKVEKSQQIALQKCNETIVIDSDPSLDAILQSSFLDKVKADDLRKSLAHKSTAINKSNLISNFASPSIVALDNSDTSADTLDGSLNFCRKRGKFYKIQESESEGDSPCQKICKWKRNQTDKTNEPSRLQGRDLLDLEAEVSDEDNVSDDEIVNESDEYEESFVDDASYSTQNNAAEMTCKYLESVKMRNNGPGTFKIPKTEAYNVEDVFSQIPNETNLEYEIDSFCVNDIEYEEKELSQLEIAEQILELDRKNKKAKQKSRTRRKK